MKLLFGFIITLILGDLGVNARDIGSADPKETHFIQSVLTDDSIQFQYCKLDATECEKLSRHPISMDRLSKEVEFLRRRAAADEKEAEVDLKYLYEDVIVASVVTDISIAKYKAELARILNRIELEELLPKNIFTLAPEEEARKAFFEALSPFRVIIIGEMHGTREIPALVTSLIKVFISSNQPVGLLLEIPKSEQAALDQFANNKDRTPLKNEPFFAREYQDGRSSLAMVDLIEDAQKLKVPMFAFDINEKEPTQDRDLGMAKNILERIKEDPKRIWIVLTGNVHSRVTKGFPGNEDYESMAWHLARLDDKSIGGNEMISFLVRYESGSAWVCMGPKASDCGENALKTSKKSPYYLEGKNFYLFIDEIIQDGHRGSVFIRKLSASKPFVQSGAK